MMTISQIQIYVVRDRLVRMLLIFEWVSLPLGAGIFVGSLIGELIAQDRTWPPWVLCIVGLIWFAIGIWRPTHRKFGFTRHTWWTSP